MTDRLLMEACRRRRNAREGHEMPVQAILSNFRRRCRRCSTVDHLPCGPAGHAHRR